MASHLRVGERVMLRLEPEHREYPVGENCPRDAVWIIKGIAPDPWHYSAMARVSLESDPNVQTSCFVDRLESSFLVQVKLAVERNQKKKNAKRQLSA